ncbi:MAG: dephospho-CoA kinase [Rickettsiales bacterium]|nr:dephospho-CoA kinase [Rickettsiales bacterium]
MKIIGITGYIASGKTTIANIFLKKRYNLFDADKMVHKIYDSKDAIEYFQELIPESIIDNRVDRKTIVDKIIKDENYLQQIESFIHPRVRKLLDEFITENKINNSEIIILDIPLLFESGLDKICDYKIFCKASKEIMLTRFLEREGGSKEQFDFLLEKQQKIDKEKLSDFIIENNQDIYSLESQINNIIIKIDN